MYKTALDDALSNHKGGAVLALLKIDKSGEKNVYKKITKACNNLDYDSFKLLDRVRKGLKKGDLKKKLRNYSNNNITKRTKAFLLGKWQWQLDIKKRTRVKVVKYKNNLVGTVTQVGSDLERFHFKKDDVYWSDFEFVSRNNVLCNHLTVMK